MLDADTFRRLVLKHTGLIYLVYRGFDFEGEDLRDAVQDFWTRLWASRETWPAGGPENEVAFLRRQARCRADDRRRDDRALKRGAEYRMVSFDREDTQERPVAERRCDLGVLRHDDAALDRALVEHAIRVVASSLSSESEAVILGRLDDHGEDFSKVTTQRAIRGFRRAIELPPSGPQDAAIRDMGEHVVLAARRIAEEAAKHPDDIELSVLSEEDTACAAEVMASSPATASPMSDERRRSGGRAASTTPTPPSARLSETLSEGPTTPSWKHCERRPAPRSRLRPSASARSRRPALSTSIVGKTSTTSRAATDWCERTVVSRSPSAVFEESSSVSGSRP